MDRSDIETAVRECVAAVLGDPTVEFNKDSKIIRDLGMNSDLTATVFIPTLEARLGVDIPSEEWEGAYTVGDVVELIWKHVEASISGSSPV